MAASYRSLPRRLGRHGRRAISRTYRRATSSSRPLPSFLIIGAQKGGTTSLYEYLAAHPMVARASTKEVHYFDLHPGRSVAWYRSHFAGNGSQKTLTGEATPYYLFHPLAPQRCARVVPEARLLVLLRNPIERAHSHHNHERTLGYEDHDFAEALRLESARLAGEEERIRADPRYKSFAHQHHSYLARGLYADQLARWQEHFPPERMMVETSERFREDPAEVLRRVQHFLDLPQRIPSRFEPRNTRTYPRIDPATRCWLLDYFASHNERLYELLGRDLGWR